MNRKQFSHRRRRVAAVSVVAALSLAPALSLTPALGAQAAPPDLGLSVSKELLRLGDVAGKALFDDSSSTDCIYKDPVPLTYSAREIILRKDVGPLEAVNLVNTAIGFMGNGHATVAKVIELPRVPTTPGARSEPGRLDPVIVVSVEPDEEGGAEVDIVAVARKLRLTDTIASPNYLFSPSGEGPTGVWPNGYPEITTLVTPVRDPGIGKDVTVAVYDVGLAPSGQSEHPPNVSELVPGLDTEVLDAVSPKGKVDQYYGGHTVAIADVINTLAPAAVVKAVRISNDHGVVTDATAVERMANTLRKKGAAPQVIVNSFGSPACDVSDNPTDGEMVPLGLEGISEAIDKRGKSVIVAAAGNRSTDRRFYPGGFDTDARPNFDAVIGVGAIDSTSEKAPDPLDEMWTSESRSGPPADFSNFGEWIDAWAPGVGLPVRHIKNLRFLTTDPLPMAGRGLVDGTSFAAPYVGALIAEQIHTSGKSSLKAWRQVRDTGSRCIVNGGTAVALTAMTDTATTKPKVDEPEC